MDTLEEIQKIIAANLGVPPTSVHSETKTSELADWDSTRHLLIVMDIEQKFGFKFGLEEIAGLDSVQKIMRAIEKKVPS